MMTYLMSIYSYFSSLFTCASDRKDRKEKKLTRDIWETFGNTEKLLSESPEREYFTKYTYGADGSYSIR